MSAIESIAHATLKSAQLQRSFYVLICKPADVHALRLRVRRHDEPRNICNSLRKRPGPFSYHCKNFASGELVESCLPEHASPPPHASPTYDLRWHLKYRVSAVTTPTHRVSHTKRIQRLLQLASILAGNPFNELQTHVVVTRAPFRKTPPLAVDEAEMASVRQVSLVSSLGHVLEYVTVDFDQHMLARRH